MNEVKNVIEEIDRWVLKKRDALRIVVLLMSKFSLKPQDFVNELKKQQRRR